MGIGRVPGPIGRHEVGAVAKTPGGVSGASARVVHKPGPAGGERRKRAPVERGRQSSTGKAQPTYEEFRQSVLRRQVARAEARGKQQLPAVPDSQLETVEGKYRMRTAAAQSCRRLLADARAALEAAQGKGDAHAKKTRSIGVCSAYRDYDYDMGQWKVTFKKHYDKMIASGTFAGREHGREAAQHMYITMLPLKAAPGFSNHSDGNAVDFQTSYGGVQYVANSDQNASWKKTWLHTWLRDNAANYGFKPLASEAWHWDYR